MAFIDIATTSELYMKINSLVSFILTGIALVMFVSIGCDDTAETGPPKTKTTTDDGHGHSHDGDDHSHEGSGTKEGDGHAHADHPAHGPFGGHIFELDSPDYKGEWNKYKDSDVIRMYILDGKGEKAAALVVDSFTVKPQAGSDDVVFEFDPEEQDENGATSVYMLEDSDLTIAIPLGVDIEIKAGDKTLKGQIKAHEALDH